MQTRDKTQESMGYYPIFLNLADRFCLVVGGGGVGTRKALMLKRCGARVQVVTPQASPELSQAGIEIIQRGYEPGDLEDVFLVFAATGDNELNRRVTEDAAARNILCNSADDPKGGDFILPAVVQRGDLLCAVSTSGASPALARKIRQDLEGFFGPEYAPFLTLMKAIRNRLLARGHDPEGHKQIFRRLVALDIPGLIAGNDIAAVDAALAEIIGPEFTYRNLMPQES